MSTTRRTFIRLVPLVPAAGCLLHGLPVHAQTQPMVDEKDPTAVALGYVADAAKVDKAKQPKYAAGQHCAVCQLYQGKAGAAAGPCPLYAGKQVAAKGWCTAFVKKA